MPTGKSPLFVHPSVADFFSETAHLIFLPGAGPKYCHFEPEIDVITFLESRSLYFSKNLYDDRALIKSMS